MLGLLFARPSVEAQQQLLSYSLATVLVLLVVWVSPSVGAKDWNSGCAPGCNCGVFFVLLVAQQLENHSSCITSLALGPFCLVSGSNTGLPA